MLSYSFPFLLAGYSLVGSSFDTFRRYPNLMTHGDCSHDHDHDHENLHRRDGRGDGRDDGHHRRRDIVDFMYKCTWWIHAGIIVTGCWARHDCVCMEKKGDEKRNSSYLRLF